MPTGVAEVNAGVRGHALTCRVPYFLDSPMVGTGTHYMYTLIHWSVSCIHATLWQMSFNRRTSCSAACRLVRVTIISDWVWTMYFIVLPPFSSLNKVERDPHLVDIPTSAVVVSVIWPLTLRAPPYTLRWHHAGARLACTIGSIS